MWYHFRDFLQGTIRHVQWMFRNSPRNNRYYAKYGRRICQRAWYDGGPSTRCSLPVSGYTIARQTTVHVPVHIQKNIYTIGWISRYRKFVQLSDWYQFQISKDDRQLRYVEMLFNKTNFTGVSYIVELGDSDDVLPGMVLQTWPLLALLLVLAALAGGVIWLVVRKSLCIWKSFYYRQWSCGKVMFSIARVCQ